MWDAIEPLRRTIDAKVFCSSIEAHEFARRDFPQSGYNCMAVARCDEAPIAQVLAPGTGD